MSDPVKIKVSKAILKRDLRTFGQMAPFALVQLGGIAKKTMLHQNGGSKPTWNEVLEFKTDKAQLRVSVYDSGNFGDQLVGMGDCSIHDKAEQSEFIVDLLHEHKLIGKVFFKMVSNKNTIAQSYEKLTEQLFEEAEDIGQQSMPQKHTQKSQDILSPYLKKDSPRQKPILEQLFASPKMAQNIFEGAQHPQSPPQQHPMGYQQLYPGSPYQANVPSYQPNVAAFQSHAPYYPQPGMVQPPMYPAPGSMNRYSNIPGQMVMQSMPSPQQVVIVKKKKMANEISNRSIFSQFSLF